MFKSLIDGIKTQLSGAPELLEPHERMHSVQHSGSAGRAAELLIAPTALLQLSPAEALAIVSYMAPRRIPMDTTFIHEGDTSETGYMLLLLEGEVTVENIVVSRIDPVTVSVLGPGSLIGEMGLIDGQARLGHRAPPAPTSPAPSCRVPLWKGSARTTRTPPPSCCWPCPCASPSGCATPRKRSNATASWCRPCSRKSTT